MKTKNTLHFAGITGKLSVIFLMPLLMLSFTGFSGSTFVNDVEASLTNTINFSKSSEELMRQTSHLNYLDDRETNREQAPEQNIATPEELGISPEQYRSMLRSAEIEDHEIDRMLNGGDPENQTDALQRRLFNGFAPNSNFGFSVSSAGDVNGDGYDDIIVGANGFNSNTGRAYIYYGGPLMNSTPDVLLNGEAANNFFGFSVSSAGDVNGDGYADVIVGAYGYSANRGRAYIYYGGQNMDNVPDVTFTGELGTTRFGYSVSSAGDVNGDGFADVIIGADGYNVNRGRAYIYYGGSAMNNVVNILLTGEAGSNYFGVSVSSAGDVNGDGFADVIVGADGYDSDRGRAYIFYGGSPMNNTPDVTMTGSAGSRFGYSVSTARDVNGDGYDDVIVGLPAFSFNTGRVYIYYGGSEMDNFPDVIISGEATSNFFGGSVAAAGDINGDGYFDVIIGARGFNSFTGRAYIYFGGQDMDNICDVHITGDATFNYFGVSVSSAGDVNGDGYADILVGANGVNTNTGRVNLYDYFMKGHITPDLTMTGVSINNGFGFSVSSAGDVNGDGYDDIIVGASGFNSSTGRAYIFTGGPGTTMTSTPFIFMTGEAIGDRFGISVSSAGDVNGDGYADVIIGADGYSSERGRAYIFYGGPNMNNIVNVTLTGEAIGDLFGSSVSSSGDVNGDGYDDVIVGAYKHNTFTGRAYIFYGGANMNNTPNIIMNGESNNHQFGESVSNAGDVNGDGYADVIVGARSYNASTGRAYIYYGGLAMDNIPNVILTGETQNIFFGRSVSSAGDVNGDGFADVIVGADNYVAATGRAYIFFGGTTMNNIPDVVLTGEAISTRFGRSVSSAGDVNGDGYDDVIVGAPHLNSNSGKAYIFYGGVAMNNTPDFVMTDEATGSNFFGQSVSTAGDVNGDGYADFIVSAPAYNSSTGRSYLYTGSAISIKPIFLHVKDVPNDQGGYVNLRWAKSGYDVNGNTLITDYMVQRSNPPVGGVFSWEPIAFIPATYESFYSYNAPTPSDSNQFGNSTFYFRITARTSNQTQFWRSAILYGRSIDNLAPAVPIDLMAMTTETTIDLSWSRNTEPDLRNYNIYRNDTLIAESFTNSFIDAIISGESPAASPFFNESDKNFKPVDIGNRTEVQADNRAAGNYTYRVSAVDVNGNESDLSNPVVVDFFPFTELTVTLIPEGFLNTVTGRLNSSDTVKAYLREVTAPYNIVDSAVAILDSVDFTATFEFKHATDGTYYIVISHRNSLTTWSKLGGENYIRGEAASYNFTSESTQAFGSNLILKGGFWCLISGDVNKNGIIDAVDRAMAWNVRNSTGYFPEDVNGDRIVDAQDRGIIWNNRNKSVLNPFNPDRIIISEEDTEFDNRSLNRR